MLDASSPRVSAPTIKPASSNLHLPFLDGLRGVAALYVVLFHIWGEMVWSSDGRGLSDLVLKSTHWMSYGSFSVAVFIVLSGYCLMLPVTRYPDSRKIDFADFLKRRARRILPPYYAALLISLFLIAVVPGLNQRSNVRWDIVLPAFTPGAILSHLFLLHNLNPQWIFKINDPLWSVATEWQIYFFFPSILLPIWRRWGNFASIGVFFALGFGIHFLSFRQLSLAHPWYLGLFALGAAGADISFSTRPHTVFWRERISWNLIALVLLGVMVFFYSSGLPSLAHYGTVMEVIAGAIAACALVYMARIVREGRHTHALVRLLETKWAIGLGQYSYSLYLTHFPVLGALHLALRSQQVSSNVAFGVLLIVGLPLSLLFAYGFSLIFEKPFLRQKVHLVSQ